MLASTSPVLTTPGLPQDAASVAKAEMGATMQSPATSTPGTKTTALRGIADNLAGRDNIGPPFPRSSIEIAMSSWQQSVHKSASRAAPENGSVPGPLIGKALGGRSWP